MKATVHLLPLNLRREFIFLEANKIPALVEHYKNGALEKSKEVEVSGIYTHAGVAEEMFDLTNNPSRDDERELLYGRGRSVSVGDIVEVESGENVESWLCMSFGWHKVG
jgi:hypothetical protein